MYRQLVREVAALGHLDRVDLADQVGDGDVRGGQLLPVAAITVQPGQLRVVPLFLHEISTASAYRVERVVVDLAARYRRYLFVQQPCQGADHARFRLPALPQEDDVLSGQEGVLQVGDDRLLEADDAWQMVCLASTNPFDEVLAQLLLDGQDLVAGLAKLPNRRRLLSCHYLPASL